MLSSLCRRNLLFQIRAGTLSNTLNGVTHNQVCFVHSELEKIHSLSWPQRKTISQYDKLESNLLKLEFQDCEKLLSSEERLQKVFQISYCQTLDKKETLIHYHLKNINLPDDRESLEYKVVKITVLIRDLQEIYAKHKSKKYQLRDSLKKLFYVRSKILGELRTFRFENYTKILEELDIYYYFPAELNVMKTHLIDDVEDMRIRAFAESRRIKAETKSRLKKLNDLKEEIKIKLERGEIEPDDSIKGLH